MERVLSSSIKDIAETEKVYLLAKPEEAIVCSAVAVCEMLTVVTVKSVLRTEKSRVLKNTYVSVNVH